eukprot:scaffold304_cov80-Skeletonema_menzelii.AAC.6
MDSIVLQRPSEAVHRTRRKEHSSPLHRPNSSISTDSKVSPSCVETSSSSPAPVTPPRSASPKVNAVPRAPSRKGCSAMAALSQHVGQQQPDPEQNTADDQQTADSFNVTTSEPAAVLLPESSPPRIIRRSRSPSTPSSHSTGAASYTSSRYSPTSSASRTPTSASSYEPLSHPSSSSSELRQRRKQRVAPPVPLPKLFHDAGSSVENRTSIRIGDDYSENNNSNEQNNQGQKHRLRHILQQHFGSHQHKEKDDDDICVGFRSCDSSIASSHYLQHSSDIDYNNMELQHEHEHNYEHEIVINPKSIEGTIESASFHLHGQTGGRVKSSNPELKNAAVMDGYALQNMMTDTDDSSMSEETCETNVRIDLENGMNVISSRGGRNSSSNNNKNLIIDDIQHEDLWSTGIAAAVVMGTASRYHKTFFMFPHGRKVIVPIILGTVALCLSIVTLKSCRFLTVLPEENSQVFELGPWSYLSPGTVYDGEVCLPYPSDMEVDTPFMVARMVSVLATCLGGGLLLLTTTMMCIPYNESSISLLGLGYILAGTLQALTMVFYQTNNCKGVGYFRGLQCKPNQDLVFCLAACVLYLACGWVLYMLQKFVIVPPGRSASQVYTCSAKSKSSDERKGILRTVEKSWTKIPSGETLVATVLVERRIGSGGKIKTVHSIQTELIDHQ